MVSKVIISPQEVRGLGNIVAKTSTEDYECYKGNITASEDKYIMEFDGTIFLLTVSKSYVHTGNSITVTVTLTDENGDPVEDASVELFKEVSE